MFEEDYLRISGIQHYAFCPRQWGLIELENEWRENILTTTGSILHEKVHQQESRDKRKDKIIVRGMQIKSDEYQIQGQCDAVEFVRDESGIHIPQYQGKFKLYPVEYKKGKIKKGNEDRLQLAAQTVCLEEMLCCQIEQAYLFYFDLKRRETVLMTAELRKELKEVISQMINFKSKNHIPRIKEKKRCKSCSFYDICLPKLMTLEKASAYIGRKLRDEDF